MTTRDVARDLASMERIMHKYLQLEERPFEFGDGIRLTRREIHTIDAVGSNPDANLTQIARLQGVTKGAMSQMVYRLVDKGYLAKTPAPDSDAELRLVLTDKGREAYQAHRAYHRRQADGVEQVLRDMDDRVYEGFWAALRKLEELADAVG